MSVKINNQSRDLLIRSLHKDYIVTFDKQLEHLKMRLSEYRNAVFVVDRRVFELYKVEIETITSDRPLILVEASESTKTLEGVQNTIEWLLKNECNRSTTIVGIGGGIVQDLVTFTSNIFYRGTSFVLIPTTLLSMSDSCIGAKCGINFGSFKNQLGVVYAPIGVHVVTDFLDSLDEIDIKSGYGEILKLSVTGSSEALDQLIQNVTTHGLRGDHLLQLIHQSLKIKQEVIEKDEYEVDLRRILNYGHTFGHALEALTNHAIPHGLGVAWGIDLINFIVASQNNDFASTDLKIHKFIGQHLPFILGEFPSAIELVNMTRRDKKMSNGVLNLALPRECGDIYICPTVLDDQLVSLVDSYLKTRNVYALNA